MIFHVLNHSVGRHTIFHKREDDAAFGELIPDPVTQCEGSAECKVQSAEESRGGDTVAACPAAAAPAKAKLQRRQMRRPPPAARYSPVEQLDPDFVEHLHREAQAEQMDLPWE
jgi:hypothetical protein